MSELWIRTDEAEDVAGSIRHALNCMDLVKVDDHAWKWVILALHTALQGACVCHLTTTAQPIGAVTDKNASEWLTYFDEKRENPQAKLPATKLMGMLDLVKEIRKPNSCGASWIKNGIKINDDELRLQINFHKNFRNQFLHFRPVGWSYEVSGVPEYTRLIARIIEDILEHGWAFRHLESERLKSFSSNLKTLAKAKLSN